MGAERYGRGAEQVALRLPYGLRDIIKAAAEAKGRSMNTEIVLALEGLFIGTDGAATADVVPAVDRGMRDAFAIAIVPALIAASDLTFPNVFSNVARDAYVIADAMIAARAAP